MPTVLASGEVLYFIHPDHLGTPQQITDANQNLAWDAVLWPFGGREQLTAAVTSNLGLPGQYFDAEDALHYNYFRDYDPSLGRYVESDPIGLRGGLNTYAYVGGNPVGFADRRGLYFGIDDAVFTLGGAAAGLIPGVRITGITIGRGSYNAIYKQIVTKAANGSICSIEPETAGKMFVGRAVDTGLVPATVATGIASFGEGMFLGN